MNGASTRTLWTVGFTLALVAACDTGTRDDASAPAASTAAQCVEGSYPDCTGAHQHWDGERCCFDVPVTCVPGSYPSCTSTNQHWTGKTCCLDSPVTCVSGTYPDCTDSAQHWTGSVCCIDGTIACDGRAAVDCFGSGEHYTGTQCCVEDMPVEVDATDDAVFVPDRIRVTVGTTVRWVNTGTVFHTVTSGASADPAHRPGLLFDAPLGPGAWYEFAFASPGTYPYFCRIHGDHGMRGTITVVPGGGGGAGPRARRGLALSP
jgi:plastocyanin